MEDTITTQDEDEEDGLTVKILQASKVRLLGIKIRGEGVDKTILIDPLHVITVDRLGTTRVFVVKHDVFNNRGVHPFGVEQQMEHIPTKPFHSKLFYCSDAHF